MLLGIDQTSQKLSKVKTRHDKLRMFTEEPLEAKCRHFGVCGGCKFQTIPYREQLEQKRAFVSSCFDRAVEPVLPSPEPWRYRNKMEFSFSQARSGEKFLGLMKSRGRVENLTECFLTSTWFAESLEKVRGWWEGTPLKAYYPPTNSGHLRTLTLREGKQTGEKMVVLTISEEALDDALLSPFVSLFEECDAVILRRQVIKKKQPTRFEETVLKGKDHIFEILHDSRGWPYRFQIRAASFFQPNTLQAEKIYQEAIALADLGGDEILLDLYCGTGSLGIFAARHVKEVKGIEIVPEAVQDGVENLRLNQISNMEIYQGDVGAMLAQNHFEPTTIIVDPPRVGLGSKTIAEIQTLKPQKIVYVSCNPLSQAADCAALGYEIVMIQPIDQFPHTPHVENIVLLHLK